MRKVAWVDDACIWPPRRLLPLPGHREGDEVDFKSKYMVPGVVMSLAE